MIFMFRFSFIVLIKWFAECQNFQKNPITKISKVINISHAKPIYALKELAGNILVTGADDSTIKFWNLNNSRLIKTIIDLPLNSKMNKTKNGFLKIDQLKNGNLIASTFQQNSFIIDIKSKKISEKYLRFNSGFSLFDMNSNGDLASYTQTPGVGSQIFIWKSDLKSFQVVKRFKIKSELHYLKIYEQNKIIIILLDYQLQIFDMNGSLNKSFAIQNDSFAFCLLPDSRLALGFKHSIQIWDLKSEKMISTLNGHKWSVYSMVYLENGDLVSAAGDDKIKVWDLKNNKVRVTLDVEYSLRSLMNLRNGLLVGGSFFGHLLIWDLKIGKLVQKLNGDDENTSDLKSALNKIDKRYHNDILRRWNETVSFHDEPKNETFNCENKVYFSISKFQTDQAYLNKTIEIGSISLKTDKNSKGLFDILTGIFDSDKCELVK